MKLSVALLLLIFFGIISCKDDAITELSCDQILFGVPNQNTGLTAEECVSVCNCKGFQPRVFSPSEINDLKNW